MEIGDKVKIGCTKHPYQRIRTHIRNFSYLNSLQDKQIKFGAVVLSPFCHNYENNETLLHQKFANKRLEGTELFDVDIEDVWRVMEFDLEHISYKDQSCKDDNFLIKALSAPLDALNKTEEIIATLLISFAETHQKLKEAEQTIESLRANSNKELN